MVNIILHKIKEPFETELIIKKISLLKIIEYYMLSSNYKYGVTIKNCYKDK
jgi:hypothetical protein